MIIIVMMMMIMTIMMMMMMVVMMMMMDHIYIYIYKVHRHSKNTQPVRNSAVEQRQGCTEHITVIWLGTMLVLGTMLWLTPKMDMATWNQNFLLVSFKTLGGRNRCQLSF